jgi:predicted Zn-dependent protease
MTEPGVPPSHSNAVLEGLAEILNLAHVGNDMQVKNFGVWRNHNWLSNNTLLDYQSVDWYIGYALDKSRNQLHCGKLMEALVTEPWQEAEPHLDVLVLKSDLYDTGKNAVSWCFGYGIEGYMAISSVNRFQKWLPNDLALQVECFKTIVMHEVGHMLGLPNSNRRDIEDNLGWHCINNNCIMRQGLNIQAWIRITEDRLRSDTPLCPHCQQDLRNYVASQNKKAVVS